MDPPAFLTGALKSRDVAGVESEETVMGRAYA
jgi:hypothetical protein